MQQLKLLEEILVTHKMEATFQTLRAEILGKFPQKPSRQFLTILQEPISKPARSKHHPKSQASNIVPCKDPNRFSTTIFPKNPANFPAHPNPNSNFYSDSRRDADAITQSVIGKIAYSGTHFKYTGKLDDATSAGKVAKLLDNRIFQKAAQKLFPTSNSLHDYTDELEFATVDKTSISESSIHFTHGNLVSKIEEPNHHYKQKEDKQESLGYIQLHLTEDQFNECRNSLKEEYNYPAKAFKPSELKPEHEQALKNPAPLLPQSVGFPSSPNSYYPVQQNSLIWECMNIPIICDLEKTGFQPEAELKLEPGDLLGGKFQVQKLLGSGVFAHVLKCLDLQTMQLTCLKMVNNSKDFLDQAIDELKLLRYIQHNVDTETNYLLNYKSCFYHREHLFIETELLHDNLYKAYSRRENYFTIPVIKAIAKQVLTGLAALHSLHIIHADLKPENILIKSYHPPEVKIIDMGNSCFFHDQLGTYVQSRSYRAPEVVLGLRYNHKVDIWSLGCVLAELYTRSVLFLNRSTVGMMARIQAIVGPWPQWMLEKGEFVHQYFTKDYFLFSQDKESQNLTLLIPTSIPLGACLKTQDENFISFLAYLLQIDPFLRPNAKEALNHPFLN